METAIPLSRRFLVGRVEKKLGKAGNVPDTILSEYDQFDDYLEMVIQFGVSENQNPLSPSFGTLQWNPSNPDTCGTD